MVFCYVVYIHIYTHIYKFNDSWEELSMSFEMLGLGDRVPQLSRVVVG